MTEHDAETKAARNAAYLAGVEDLLSGTHTHWSRYAGSELESYYNAGLALKPQTTAPRSPLRLVEPA